MGRKNQQILWFSVLIIAATLCATLGADRDFAGHVAVRDSNEKHVPIYNKLYTILYGYVIPLPTRRVASPAGSLTMITSLADDDHI